ncbi:sporulation protein Cse60 [Paenibacillus lautus]|uniref:sporulation protein Cse60 n=1 Tax=Paenibacillus lautus TaxID=1401 RepID=UPI003D2B4992
MFRVKTFESTDLAKLEQYVNDFLAEFDSGNNANIGVSYVAVPLAINTHTEYGVYSEVNYTAMVSYTNKD